STTVVWYRPVHGRACEVSAVATPAPRFRGSPARLASPASAGNAPPPDRRHARPRCAGNCRRVGPARGGQAGRSAGVLPYLPGDGAVRRGSGAVYDVSHDAPGPERLRNSGRERAVAGHAAPAE